MKRFFAFFLTLGVMMFAACEPATEDPAITITSATTMEFEAEGGQGEITYTITTPANGLQVVAYCNASWIDGLTSGESVTFIVLANQSESPREDKILITYGNSCNFEVTVKQKSAEPAPEPEFDKELTLKYMYGEYYGTEYTNGSTYNYYITLSDYAIDEEGYYPDNATVYALDLFSSVKGEGEYVTIPNGTYTLDLYESFAANTLGSGYSCMADANDNYYFLSEATVVVNDNSIDAVLKFEDGQLHHITYKGSLFAYNSEGDGSGDDDWGDDEWGDEWEDYYYTTLTDDFSFAVDSEDAYCYCGYYGDFYEIGYNNHYVEFYEDINTGNGLYLLLDLLGTPTSTTVEGTYTALDEYATDYEYTFVTGYPDEEGYMFGSWITTIEDGQVTETSMYAPLYDGTITISNNGGIMTAKINCHDDAGNAITGTFTAAYESYNGLEGMSYSPSKVRKQESVRPLASNKNRKTIARKASVK